MFKFTLAVLLLIPFTAHADDTTAKPATPPILTVLAQMLAEAQQREIAALLRATVAEQRLETEF